MVQEKIPRGHEESTDERSQINYAFWYPRNFTSACPFLGNFRFIYFIFLKWQKRKETLHPFRVSEIVYLSFMCKLINISGKMTCRREAWICFWKFQKSELVHRLQLSHTGNEFKLYFFHDKEMHYFWMVHSRRPKQTNTWYWWNRYSTLWGSVSVSV